MTQIDGSACRCGRTVAPARRYCPDCQRAMTPARLEAAGVVDTQTTIEVTAEGIEPPVHVAVVRVAPGSKGKPPVRILVRATRAVATGEGVTLESRGDVLWAVPR